MEETGMALVEVNLPPPSALRGGWAALAAVCAARGWGDVVYAMPDQWLYHDGGGNWACLRFVEKDKLLLIGHDHEYSDTYHSSDAATGDSGLGCRGWRCRCAKVPGDACLIFQALCRCISRRASRGLAGRSSTRNAWRN